MDVKEPYYKALTAKRFKEAIIKDKEHKIKEIAAICKIAPETVRRWIQKHRGIPEDKLYDVAAYFKVPPEFFLTNPNLPKDQAIRIIDDPTLMDKYMPEHKSKDSLSATNVSISNPTGENSHQLESYGESAVTKSLKSSIDTNDDLFIQFIKHLGKRGIIDEDQYFIELSSLVNVLSDDATRILMLERLTKQFPKEPLLWAHLAITYCSAKQTNLAIETADYGIKISQPIDVFLYYAMGKCLSSAVFSLMDGIKDYDNFTPDKMTRLKYLVEQAGKQFEKCREMETTIEDGYIFHIELIMKVLDFGHRISEQNDPSGFLKGQGYEALWYCELLILVGSLFVKLKRLYGDKEDHPFIEEVNGRLESLVKYYNKR